MIAAPESSVATKRNVSRVRVYPPIRLPEAVQAPSCGGSHAAMQVKSFLEVTPALTVA